MNTNYTLLVVGLVMWVVAAMVISANKVLFKNHAHLRWYRLPDKFWEQVLLVAAVLASGLSAICIGLNSTSGSWFATTGAVLILLAVAALVLLGMLKLSQM